MLTGITTLRDRTEAKPLNIYFITAVLFVITAVFAFSFTSLRLIEEVTAGSRPLPPPVVHLHAVAMTLWLLLLLAQTWLMGRGRAELHFRLGLSSLALAPLMLVAMVGVVHQRMNAISSMAPELAARLLQNAPNQLLVNAGGILLFPLFFIWALLARCRDSETHKRMMLLATLSIMGPATGRLVNVSGMLPDLGLSGADAPQLYLLLLLIPALAHDLVRRGAVHRAYVYGLAFLTPYWIAVHFLWGSRWWLEHGPKLFGMD